jgi:hypothetical protein
MITLARTTIASPALLLAGLQNKAPFSGEIHCSDERNFFGEREPPVRRQTGGHAHDHCA